jgi:hypothetical protein
MPHLHRCKNLVAAKNRKARRPSKVKRKIPMIKPRSRTQMQHSQKNLSLMGQTLCAHKSVIKMDRLLLHRPARNKSKTTFRNQLAQRRLHIKRQPVSPHPDPLEQ